MSLAGAIGYLIYSKDSSNTADYQGHSIVRDNTGSKFLMTSDGTTKMTQRLQAEEESGGIGQGVAVDGRGERTDASRTCEGDGQFLLAP